MSKHYGDGFHDPLKQELTPAEIMAAYIEIKLPCKRCGGSMRDETDRGGHCYCGGGRSALVPVRDVFEAVQERSKPIG